MFIPLLKVDAAQRMVYGHIDETPDLSGEIFDYASSKPEFKKWSERIAVATDGKSVGNVRAMHGTVAAGKLEQIEFDDVKKSIDLAARIVDDSEWAKVEAGVYTGFSPGGKYLKRWQDGQYTRYTACPREVSIVDLPCIPSASFTLVKAAGETVAVPFKSTPLDVLKKYLGEQAWDASDAIDALTAIYSVLRGEIGESESAPEQVKALQDAIQRLKDFIASEIQEADDTLAQAAPTGDLAKKGARNSKADLDKIQAIHDHAISLGATCSGDTGKAVTATDLAKSDLGPITAKLHDEITGICKAIGLPEGGEFPLAKVQVLITERDSLKKRVAELEALPAAGGPRLKILDKADDHTPAEPAATAATPAKGDDFDASLKKIEAMPAGEEKRLALKKLAETVPTPETAR